VRFASGPSVGVPCAGDGTQGAKATQLQRPSRIFVDDAETVFVADFYNHRIQKSPYRTLSDFTVSGSGTDGDHPTQLSYPTSVIVDTRGYIYISNVGNSRITRWKPNSDFGVCIAACSGLREFQSDQLTNPHNLVFDSSGSLYVRDSSNH